MNSTEFTCKCGKMKGWVSDDGSVTKPCPQCGRKYKGRYNKKKLTIEAIEQKARTRVEHNGLTEKENTCVNKKTMFFGLFLMNVAGFIFSTDFFYPKFKLFEFVCFAMCLLGGSFSLYVYKNIDCTKKDHHHEQAEEE